jgi:hypothetical protein
MLNRTWMFVAGLCAACALPTTSAGAAVTDLYVALGDSYTSAPLVPHQVGMPAGCARSDQNYPSLVAGSSTPSPPRRRS